jgi:hypothetical protein
MGEAYARETLNSRGRHQGAVAGIGCRRCRILGELFEREPKVLVSLDDPDPVERADIASEPTNWPVRNDCLIAGATIRDSRVRSRFRPGIAKRRHGFMIVSTLLSDGRSSTAGFRTAA